MIKRGLYLDKIRPFIGKEPIKVLTGMRRSGKSVMLELIKEEILAGGVSASQVLSLNFENLSYSNLLTAEALHQYIIEKTEGLKEKVYLFFDEIQEVAGWEKCVNSLRVSLDCDIYITGSNARLLSGELATYLAGRYVEFVIYPFSFGEFLELYSDSSRGGDIGAAFRDYIRFGGFPYLAHLSYDEAASIQYLKDIFHSVQLKDIVQRNHVRDAWLLERIIAYMMMHVGTIFSATSLSKFFKSEGRSVSTDTILNYIKYSCDAYLFYQVKRQNIQGKKLLQSNEKYYMADHGMREALYFKNSRDIHLVLENIVFMELKRRGYEVSVGLEGDREIDFVCEKRGEKFYIQVAYLLASEDTVEREFGIYDRLSDHYPKYVLSMDEFDMSRNGVKHRNIRDFLLMEDWG